MESPYAWMLDGPALWLGLLIVLAIAAVALAARARPRPAADAAELIAGVSDQNRAQAHALVTQGQPEQAVALLHNHAGLSQADARAYVDTVVRAAGGTPARGGPAGDAEFSEIHALLARGNKIHAIKLYRERFNVGLKEAKDAVEEIERGQRPPAAPPRPAPASGAVPSAGLDEIHQLLARGNKIQAIKRYRELSGVGLKEAKDYVEALDTQR